MRFDEPAAERQPEACPQALWLRGEERLEDASLDLERDPWPRVAHRHDHTFPSGIIAGRQAQPPRRRRVAHRVLRVRNQVDQNLLELVAVRPHARRVRGEVALDLDIRHAQLIGQQLDGLAAELPEWDLRALGRAPASHGEKVPHDPGAAFGRRADLLASGPGLAVRRALREQLNVAEDDRQRVVQLVGDARDELAER